VSAARDRLSSRADRSAVRHGAPSPRVTFLHPWALVGLTAAAIPALLHLLERRVPPDAVFPPIRYLTEAERQSARRLKLRHLLLLILRTALIALLVIAAARPLVQSRGGGAGAGGAHEPTARGLILDNSPSAGAVVAGAPVLAGLTRGARAATAAAARVTDGVLAVTLSGTSGAGPAPLTVRLRGRTVGRMLAAPGASVPIPLPSVAPGWWVGDVALDPDELRSDDRRAFVWRVAPP